MLKGPDVSLEISLKEYGIAWEIGETETRFYFGIKYDGSKYVLFDWADLENNLDVAKEYDWADLLQVTDFVGLSLKEWEKMPLTGKIQDMRAYYGIANTFGGINTKGMSYEEVIKEVE